MMKIFCVHLWILANQTNSVIRPNPPKLVDEEDVDIDRILDMFDDYEQDDEDIRIAEFHE